jgi:hypothetical protein
VLVESLNSLSMKGIGLFSGNTGFSLSKKQ